MVNKSIIAQRREEYGNMICGYIVYIKTVNDEHNSIKSIKSELISYYD